MKARTKLSVLSFFAAAPLIILSGCIQRHNKKVEEAQRAMLEWQCETALPQSFTDLKQHLTSNHEIGANESMSYYIDICKAEKANMSHKDTQYYKHLKEQYMAGK